MSGHIAAVAASTATVSGHNLIWVVIVGVVALLALVVAWLLVREVLAADQGTEKMQEISRAVQEGAAAYLRRQFKTLGVFVFLLFFVLLVLSAPDEGVRVGRSILKKERVKIKKKNEFKKEKYDINKRKCYNNILV